MQLSSYPGPGGGEDDQEGAGQPVQGGSTGECKPDANVSGPSQSASSSNRTSATEEPPISLKNYIGREWSEVAHLLQVPPDSEPEVEDEEPEWAPSQLSADTQDDPFTEDIHDLVDVLDNLIRAQSNSRCDSTRFIDYLDLDIFKYETVLSAVQDLSWETDEFLNEESSESSDGDAAPSTS